MKQEINENLEKKILFKLRLSDYGEGIGIIGFVFQAIVLIYMIYSSRIPTAKDVILFLLLTFMMGLGLYSYYYKTRIQDAMIDALVDIEEVKANLKRKQNNK